MCRLTAPALRILCASLLLIAATQNLLALSSFAAACPWGGGSRSAAETGIQERSKEFENQGSEICVLELPIVLSGTCPLCHLMCHFPALGRCTRGDRIDRLVRRCSHPLAGRSQPPSLRRRRIAQLGLWGLSTPEHGCSRAPGTIRDRGLSAESAKSVVWTARGEDSRPPQEIRTRTGPFKVEREAAPTANSRGEARPRPGSVAAWESAERSLGRPGRYLAAVTVRDRVAGVGPYSTTSVPLMFG